MEARPLNLPPSLAKTKIVFATYRSCRTVGACGEIFMMNADGTDIRNVTHNDPAGQEFSPAFSPDLRSIAFVSSRAGAYDIYVMELADESIVRLTTTPDICEFNLSWSPDGSQILFGDDCGLYSEPYGTGTQQDGDLWVVNVDGSGSTNITNTPNANELGGDWSPNGNRIVFGRDGDLYLADPDGGATRELWSGKRDTAWYPRWCGSSRSVVFPAADPSGNEDVFVVSTRPRDRGSVAHRVTSHPARQTLPSCSPDGTKIAYQGETRLGAANYKIYIVDRAGGNDTVVPTCGACREYEPIWQRAS